MNLYDEEEVRNQREKNRKIKKYIKISIIITIVFIIVLMGIIFYLIYNPNKITIRVNGREDESLESLLLPVVSEKDDTTSLYLPIRDLAAFSKYWTYSSFNGDYVSRSEDEDSCYIRSENEIAIFRLNSSIIYKIDLEQQSNSTNDYNFEEVKVSNPVIKRDNKLYADLESIKEAFNLKLQYNEKSKTISITTLNSLLQEAQGIMDSNKNLYSKMDNAFVNQKTLLDDMIVVEGTNNGSKGVIGITRNNNGRIKLSEILGMQYEDIKYIPQKQLFIVKRNNKVGIMGTEGTNKTKIEIKYDTLTLIDNENNLYLAKMDNRYGVIDINENTIIHMEYDKIGIDISNYSKNGVKNGYILLNNLIPVQKNNKWGFYQLKINNNQDGSKTIRCGILGPGIIYDNIGCITSVRRGTVSNLLLIEEFGVVVVSRNRRYGFLESTGEEIPLSFTDMYMETEAGNTNYYMVYTDGKAYDIIKSLENKGVTKKVK